MQTPLSGAIFKDIVSFQWAFSGTCAPTKLSFQLYDHNQQWLEIAQLS